MCQGGYRDMDRMEKVDCRTNGAVVFKTMRTLHLDSLKFFDLWSTPGLFQEKEMGYAIKSFKPRTTTDRRYPMLPATITNTHQAFKETRGGPKM